MLAQAQECSWQLAKLSEYLLLEGRPFVNIEPRSIQKWSYRQDSCKSQVPPFTFLFQPTDKRVPLDISIVSLSCPSNT